MRSLAIVVLFMITIYGCSSDVVKYTYTSTLNNDLSYANLYDEGFNPTTISELDSKLLSGEFPGINSIIISRNNQIVYEQYLNDSSPDTRVWLYSAGKSITSAFVGLAVDRGLISTDESVVKFFEPYFPMINNFSKMKMEMEFKHLLSMSAGIECGEFADPETDLSLKMKKSFKPIKTYLDEKMESEPGKIFKYTDSAPIVARTMLGNVINEDVYSFQNKHLYEPLGIDYQNLHKGFTPYDLLKFGLMYMNDGSYAGQQILSPEWIEESTTFKIDPEVPEEFADGYGYYWWLKKFDYKGKKVRSYFAAGNGEQYLFVIPDLQLVIVFTGSNYNWGEYSTQPHEIVQNYIIKSLGAPIVALN